MANIIGDIAGNYKTLLALLSKCPYDEPISVGDMVDRGPRSKDVLNFFMNNGRAILGNHEHMMIDYLNNGGYYDRGTWFYNGGRNTILSYTPDEDKPPSLAVPKDVLTWLEGLPLYLEVDGCLISHSFIAPHLTLDESCKFGRSIYEVDETRIIWNREPPVRRAEWKIQICGHNSQFGLREFNDDDGLFALCLDDCRKKVLTAYNTHTGMIYQQEYID